MNLTPHPVLPVKTWFGKYRGIVLQNVDPMQIGRIIAEVPAVLGQTPSSWALPCVPAAGIQSGIFIVPPIGSQVWIEFEGGSPNEPIWTGGFWPLAADVPVSASTPPPIPPGQNIVLQTTLGHVITLSDATVTPGTGGITLRTPGGATLIINDDGIILSNGKGAVIQLLGPQIIFNNAATLVGDEWSPAPQSPPE
jgi:hypothetical protein